MQIVIDIPEVLNSIKTFKGKFICENGYDLIQGIKNGKSIPKGHGKLGDLDKLRSKMLYSHNISAEIEMNGTEKVINYIFDNVPKSLKQIRRTHRVYKRAYT